MQATRTIPEVEPGNLYPFACGLGDDLAGAVYGVMIDAEGAGGQYPPAALFFNRRYEAIGQTADLAAAKRLIHGWRELVVSQQVAYEFRGWEGPTWWFEA